MLRSFPRNTTKEGLSIRSELDANSYPLAREITDGQINGLSIKPDNFHGEWNYSILPRI
jgi:hypothetical protein